uniref:Uncharacterized protein n=1 Tax=Arundo donax TaxID=35708 RepID=A0A0A8XQK9_ARUDO
MTKDNAIDTPSQFTNCAPERRPSENSEQPCHFILSCCIFGYVSYAETRSVFHLQSYLDHHGISIKKGRPN